MPDVDSQSKSETIPASDGPDPLAGLYHMSNTAGLGTQDYVAINPVAIWSVFFGVASVLAVLSNVLLAIPLVGLGVARSSRSFKFAQAMEPRPAGDWRLSDWPCHSGSGCAKLGYLIYTSLAFRPTSSVLANQCTSSVRILFKASMTRRMQCSKMLSRRGSAAPNSNAGSKPSTISLQLGRLQSVEWNHQPIAMEERPDTGITDAYGMAYFMYSNTSEPRRVVIGYQKINGVWHPGAIESIFPAARKQQK